MGYNWNFSFLWNYRGVLFDGLLNTVSLALTILVLGFCIGMAMALVRLARSPILNAIGAIYVELFRNVPALVLLFWFFYALPVLFGLQNDRFITAVVAFSLYTGAYFCEILRSGIQGVPKGQWEASLALGFSRSALFFSIILPQAIKRVLPALTNEAIEVVKISAVAATIAYPDLLYSAKLISDTEYRPVETYTMVGILLIGFILILSGISYLIEHRMKRSG